jgi:hypothetical protein
MDGERQSPSREEQRTWLPPALASKLASMRLRMAMRHQVHSSNALRAAGFQYIGNSDTARCDDCSLEVSGWTSTMIPFDIHAERKPDCSFVCSMRPAQFASTPNPSISFTRGTRTTTRAENSSKHFKSEATGSESVNNSVIGTSSLQQIRRILLLHPVRK